MQVGCSRDARWYLGSSRIITDKNGNVISRKDFSAFGEATLSAQRTANPEYTVQDEPTRKGYTGYEKDGESGLDYAQARYYNSSHGRFTSVDPLTASAEIRNPQTFNRYSYVTNSPYKFVDPLGLRGADISCGGNSSGGGQGSTLRSCEAERSLDRYNQALENTSDAAAVNRAVANDDQTTADAICASNSNITCERSEHSGIVASQNDSIESFQVNSVVYQQINNPFSLQGIISGLQMRYGVFGVRNIGGQNWAITEDISDLLNALISTVNEVYRLASKAESLKIRNPFNLRAYNKIIEKLDNFVESQAKYIAKRFDNPRYMRIESPNGVKSRYFFNESEIYADARFVYRLAISAGTNDTRKKLIGSRTIAGL